MTSPARPLLVAVHGAFGAQGAPVVRALRRRGHRVRALTRTPRPGRAEAGVELVASTLTDADALMRAYEGVDAAVIILPGGAASDEAERQADTILATLRAAGVRRAVFNAGGGIWRTSPNIPFLQARTRLALVLPDAVPIASVAGPASTLMENFSEGWVADRLRRTGALVGMAAPHAVMRPVAMVDLAETMIDTLAEDAPPRRIVVRGPGEVTPQEVAATIGERIGRAVRYETVSAEEYLRGVAGGLGEQYAANIGALYGPGVNVPPPDAPEPTAQIVTGFTTLSSWVASQDWGALGVSNV